MEVEYFLLQENAFKEQAPELYKKFASELDHPLSFKSLKVTKNIKEISKNKPIRKNPSWVF